MVNIIILVLFTIILCVFGYFLTKKQKYPYPPGPVGLPIFGNLLQMGKEPQKVLNQWAIKYGNIYMCKMGMLRTIVLSDADIIRNVYNRNSASGRTTNPIFRTLANGRYGVGFTDGKCWREQRLFAIKTLKDLGFPTKSMQNIITLEISHLLKYFESKVNQPTRGDRIFNGAMLNILWNLVAGERLDWVKKDDAGLIQYTEDIISSVNRANETGLMIAPFLRHIFPNYTGWTKFITSVEKLSKVVNEKISEHEKNLDINNPRDLIDFHLVETLKTTDPTSSFYKDEGRKNLVALVSDLCLAGSETTSHTMSWALQYLAHYPSVQEKIQNEIDTQIGKDRLPVVKDKLKMPYTEATVLEILRMSSILNNGVPHEMLEDDIIEGYLFPKGAMIITNSYLVHYNPAVWEDAKVFKPERFLSEHGALSGQNNLLPFSIGKRRCPGEQLAKDTTFLCISSLLQKLGIKPAPENTLERLMAVEPTNKMINEAYPFEVIFGMRD